MRKFLLLAALLPLSAAAQITITAADMPVLNDTLRHSEASPTSVSLSAVQATGANTTWNFSTLTPLGQTVDTFKTAAAINISYALTISPTAYGYKLGDSLPGLGAVVPISVQQVYNFYNKKNSPSRFVTEGFAAEIGGFPTPVTYSDEDEVYFFPLDYNDVDSSNFRLNFSIAGLGSMMQKGYRKTTVDGWGTITTPYFTTPVQALRVKSQIVEIDSVTFGPTSLGFPRNTIEYKWLVNGEHYPALYVISSINLAGEQIGRVSYRDTKRAVSVGATPAPVALSVHPNPTTGRFTVTFPAGWQNTTAEVYDVTGKLVLRQENSATLDLQGVPSGTYLLRAGNGVEFGYTQVVKQ